MRLRLLALVLVAFLGNACGTLTHNAVLEFGTGIRLYEQAGLLNRGVEVPGDSHAAQLEQLKLWLPCLIVETPLGRGLLGLSRVTFDEESGLPTGCTIFLNAGTGANTQLNTLAHEVTHVLDHHAVGFTYDRNRDEVVAETTAYLVCKSIGLDTFRQSAQYLLKIDEDARTRILYHEEANIRRYAAVIEAGAFGLPAQRP